MIKIVTVVGARPQFVKAAAVSGAIAEFNKECCRGNDRIVEKVIHTGQHYDYLMDGVFFDELRLKKPDYNLGIGSHPHGKQTGLMLEGIEKILKIESPECVVVYGDTNSTLAGALAAKKMAIPVAHVEAGLRSFEAHMPEEINRVLVDRISDILFCPSENAIKNLSAEGINQRFPLSFPYVSVSGDVMYDAILLYLRIARKISKVLEKESLSRKGYYLLTVHRAENTDNAARLRGIISTFNKAAKNGFPVIFPAHPRTMKAISALGIELSTKNFRIIAPQPYFDMLILEENAKAIITDSGGLQKEAFFLNVPCITLRENTEWIETVRCGCNAVVGADRAKIYKALADAGTAKFRALNCYGNGNASHRIVKSLKKIFSKK